MVLAERYSPVLNRNNAGAQASEYSVLARYLVAIPKSAQISGRCEPASGRSELADRHSQPEVEVGDGLVVHAVLDPDPSPGLPLYRGWVGDDEAGRCELVEDRLDRRRTKFKCVADGAGGDVRVRSQVSQDRCFDEAPEKRDRLLGTLGTRWLSDTRHEVHSAAPTVHTSSKQYDLGVYSKTTLLYRVVMVGLSKPQAPRSNAALAALSPKLPTDDSLIHGLKFAHPTRLCREVSTRTHLCRVVHNLGSVPFPCCPRMRKMPPRRPSREPFSPCTVAILQDQEG